MKERDNTSLSFYTTTVLFTVSKSTYCFPLYEIIKAVECDSNTAFACIIRINEYFFLASNCDFFIFLHFCRRVYRLWTSKHNEAFSCPIKKCIVRKI